MITIAAALWGVAIICFGFSNNFYLALFFLGVAGFFDMISGIFRGTIWNQTIPDHLRGRLAGIEMISYLTGPMLGDAEAGIVAHYFGLKNSIHFRRNSGRFGNDLFSRVAAEIYRLRRARRYQTKTARRRNSPA